MISVHDAIVCAATTTSWGRHAPASSARGAIERHRRQDPSYRDPSYRDPSRSGSIAVGALPPWPPFPRADTRVFPADRIRPDARTTMPGVSHACIRPMDSAPAGRPRGPPVHPGLQHVGSRTSLACALHPTAGAATGGRLHASSPIIISPHHLHAWPASDGRMKKAPREMIPEGFVSLRGRLAASRPLSSRLSAPPLPGERRGRRSGS